jgi:hypothetical protein
MSLSLFIIVRAFSGLSQALLIATCTAKKRKGKERKGRERGKERKKRGQVKSMAEKRALPEQKDLYLWFF